MSALSLMWMTFFDVTLGHRVGAGDAAVEDLAEIEVFLLCALHVQRASRRGEALQVCQTCAVCPRVLVHGFDRRKVNCLSSLEGYASVLSHDGNGSATPR